LIEHAKSGHSLAMWGLNFGKVRNNPRPGHSGRAGRDEEPS
jgi:hypothetical protein